LCAGRLARLAETELRASGARPRRVSLTGLEALTASERPIAEMAAHGLTNREIAQRGAPDALCIRIRDKVLQSFTQARRETVGARGRAAGSRFR
jgi:hypothetical protein